MSKRTTRFILAGILVGVCLFVFVFAIPTNRAFQSSPGSSGSSARYIKPPALTRGLAPRQDGSENLGQYATQDFPAVNPYTFAFQVARDCMKFRRLSSFFAAQRDDPGSVLNNKTALELLSKDDRLELANNRGFVAAKAVECSAWWRGRVGAVSATLDVYAAALDAALRGDREAASCYVMAAWERPNTSDQGSGNLMTRYARYAPLLIRKGIAAGDWAMVSAATVAIRPGVDVGPALTVEPADAYLYLRLAQLGAGDSGIQQSFGERASDEARKLSPEKLRQAESLAMSTYHSAFDHSKMSYKELNQPCDM